MLELYENIRKRRIELNMTQEELAKKTGYSGKRVIAKIEKGKVDLTQTKIIAFAEALRIAPGDLMGWDGIEVFELDANETADLIKKYSLLSAANKKAVSSLIDNLLEAQSMEYSLLINTNNHLSESSESSFSTLLISEIRFGFI